MVKVVKIFVLSMLFWQCGKKNTSFPEVVIQQPNSGQIVTFGDDLLVRAALSHENLERFRLAIVDENRLASFLTAEGNITGPEYTVERIVSFDNPNMASGNYLVRVSAFTSDDNSSYEVPITYVKKPMETAGFLTVTDLGNTFSAQLHRYNESMINLGPWVGQGIRATVISDVEQAVLAPQQSGVARVIDTKTGNVLQTVNDDTQGQFPFFMSLSSTNRRFTLGNYLGFVQTRDASQQLVHNFSLPTDYYATFTAEGHDFMLVNVVHPTNDFNAWRVYNPRTAANMGERFTQDQILAAFPADANRWWVFYKDGTTSRMARWTPEGALDVRVGSFSGDLISVQRLSEHRFFVLTLSGITEVDVRQSGTIPRSEYGTGQWFDYNPLADRILVADGLQIREYDVASSTLLQQYTLDNDADYVGYIYDKPF